MPTVYKDQLNVHAMTGRIAARATGDDFGAIEAQGMRFEAQAKANKAQGNVVLARGLGDVGQAVYTINARMDEANANELDAQYTEFERKLLHDPDSGYFNKKGKEALDGRTAVEDEITNQISSLAKSARSPRARAAFYGVARRRAADTLTRTDDYAARQMDVYENATSEARIAEATQNAALEFNDPVALQNNILTVTGQAALMARRAGLDGEAEKYYIQTRVSGAYAAALEGMATENPEKAYALFTENKGKMTVGDATKVERMLKPAMLDARGRALSEDAWNKTGGDYEEALKLVDAEKDTALRDEAVRRLDDKMAHVERTKSFAEAAAADYIYKVLANGGTLSSVSAKVKADMDPQALYQLKESLADKARSYINGDAPEQKAASRQVSNWLTAMSMQDAGYEVTRGMPKQPSTRTATGVRKFVEPGFLEGVFKQYYVSPEDQLRLTQRRATIRGGGEGDGTLEQKTFTKALKSAQIALGPAGIDITPTSKNKDAFKKGQAFQATLMDSVREFSEKEKREPDQKEMDTLVSKAILNSDTKFGSSKPSRSKIAPTDSKRVVSYDMIPRERRLRLQKMLADRNPGAKVLESDVENAYAEFLQRED